MSIENITEIPSFDHTSETCFVCGQTATTREHLFPKWLQREFNLWDQRLIIPNKTSIAYRQLTIPCCNRCNNEVYSSLEYKISNKTESEADMWRWANKVHFALTLKDKFLDWDRKNPGYKIGDVISVSDPLETSRHFLHCVSGDFVTEPDPFGSVFRFDFTEKQDYNFVHIINSSSICISFGDRGYVVFIKDGQFLRDNLGIIEDFNLIKGKDEIKMHDMLFFYAKVIEFYERFEISLPLLITKGKILKIGNATIRKEKPVNKKMLSAICRYMGFTWIDADTLK